MYIEGLEVLSHASAAHGRPWSPEMLLYMSSRLEAAVEAQSMRGLGKKFNLSWRGRFQNTLRSLAELFKWLSSCHWEGDILEKNCVVCKRRNAIQRIRAPWNAIILEFICPRSRSRDKNRWWNEDRLVGYTSLTSACKRFENRWPGRWPP